MQYRGTGRRKKSVARVRLLPGEGKVVINDRDLQDYFGMDTLIAEVRRPLETTGTLNKFDVLVKVEGGFLRPGLSGMVSPEPFWKQTENSAPC